MSEVDFSKIADISAQLEHVRSIYNSQKAHARENLRAIVGVSQKTIVEVIEELEKEKERSGENAKYAPTFAIRYLAQSNCVSDSKRIKALKAALEVKALLKKSRPADYGKVVAQYVRRIGRKDESLVVELSMLDSYLKLD